MGLIYLAGVVLVYLIGFAFTYGYLSPTHERDYADLFKGPVPQAVAWPIVLTYMIAASPFQRMGLRLAEKQLEQRRVRVAAQEKIRVELEQAERELEEQLSQDDDSSHTQTRRAVS